MIRSLIHTIKRRMEPKALVLMYHRVAVLESDVWRLAVSPQHFEQHLKVLSNKWRVLSLEGLVEAIEKRKLKRNCIVITFDDGYADNFLIAKPLLEKYSLPATFFISSANIGNKMEFWWDELENIVLFTPLLPQTIAIQLGSTQVIFDLEHECLLNEDAVKLHRKWRAYKQAPPTLRCSLFLRLWETLKPLPHYTQQECLEQIKHWANIAYKNRPLYHCMNIEQLKELGQTKLFRLGAHTSSHPDLTSLDATSQHKEILENKAFLEEISSRTVNVLAYPYGRHDNETVAIAAKANFKAAVTTSSELVKPLSEKLLLGRFLVDDWSGEELDRLLKMWFRS